MNAHGLLFDLITLAVTIDPLGTLPLFLSLTRSLSPAQRRSAAVRATLIAFGLLAGFLYFGQYVLEAMHIQLPSFQIAGGIVLFLFALGMIFERESAHGTGTPEAGRDVAVFPLAMPAIATPGALLAVVVLTDNNTHSLLQQTATCGMLVIVLATNLALMLLGGRLVQLLGQAGLGVMSRVMGMILAAAAVELVYSALRGQFQGG